ncbi:hypothetical protein Tco_0717761 [Tanacetum coccineum]
MAEDASSKKFLTGHFKRDCRSGKKNNANAGGSKKGFKVQSQGQGQNFTALLMNLRVDRMSGATTHVCKDRCWFKTYEPIEDGSVLHMGDDHFDPIHGKGSVALEFSSRKTITLFNVLYVPKLRFGYYNNESRDVVFDENRFSSIPKPKDVIPNSVESQRDDHSDDVPSEVPEPS